MDNKKSKKRNWTFILYPESAPADWKDILISTGLPFSVSPLHDKDINSDGEPKKSHYHVILCYPGPTTFNSVKSLVERLNSPIPQGIESVRGIYRYFTHKDNPEKYQYSESDILCFNSFSILDFTEFTRSERNSLRGQLQDFVREHDIFEYSDLMDILRDNDLSDLFEIASTNTYFIDKYISSRRNKNKV